MKTWQDAAADARFSGGAAAAGSLAMLALCGSRSIGSATAAINAPSHIVWGDVALRKNGPSVRYTLPGLALHVGSSLFWGVLYEKFLAPPAGAGAATILRNAGLATAGAALVDLRLVPSRLTPGFERRLPRAGLLLVYGAFALGLAVGGCAAAQRRQAGRLLPAQRDQPELEPLGPFPTASERPFAGRRVA
ncbi:MAG: hypothetical protein H0W48_15315 [Methylibium sp.]|nr:hypothetical protein [Methylibium sp.]